MGDTRERNSDTVAGKFGLGKTNTAGVDLIEWWHANQSAWVNSFFQHKNRGTWKNPANGSWHELDGFLVKQKERSRKVVYVSTVGVNKLSDHRAKRMTCTMENKKKRHHGSTKVQRRRTVDWDKLKIPEVAAKFREKIENPEDSVEDWNDAMKLFEKAEI